MEYTIEKKVGISLAGTSKKFRIKESNHGISEFWREIANNDALNKIHEVKTDGPNFNGHIVSVWQESEVDPAQVIYSIGTEYDVRNSIYALEIITIPDYTWAIFRCTGALPDAMHEAKKAIFNDFLPASELRVINTLHLEVYSDDNKKQEDYQFEIWVPLID